jgi:transcriptional regulator with XRE-family HTH domain
MKTKPLSKDQKKYMKKLGERMKELRKKAGYSSYEYFAYENEMSASQYAKYERGGNIQFDTLIKIIRALGVTFEEFFDGFD